MLLSLITLMGLFFRLYKQVEYIDFFGDVGRDFLAAKQISELGVFVNVRPVNALSEYIENSSFYYNLIALYWKIFPSYLSSNTFHTLLSSLIIPISYLIGKMVGNRNSGIYLASFFSFSHVFISTARLIWQPNLLPYLVLPAIYFLIKYFDHKKIMNIFISILFTFLAINIHYSMLTALPIFTFWYLFIFFHHIKKLSFKLKISLSTIFIAYNGFLAFVFKYLSNFDLKIFMSYFYQNTYQEINIISLKESFSLIAINMFGDYFFSTSILVFAFLISIIYMFKKDVEIKQKIIVSFNFSLLFYYLFSKQLYLHYLLPLIIFLYISMAIFLYSYVKKKYYSLILFTFFLVIFMHNVHFLSKIGFMIYFQSWERNEYAYTKRISSIIANNINSESNNFFPELNTVTQYNDDGYDNLPFYFFLENDHNIRLSKISENKKFAKIINNFERVNKNPNLLFIICDRLRKNTDTVSSCLNPALIHYPDFAQIKPIKIYETEYDGNRFLSTTIYKLKK